MDQFSTKDFLSPSVEGTLGIDQIPLFKHRAKDGRVTFLSSLFREPEFEEDPSYFLFSEVRKPACNPVDEGIVFQCVHRHDHTLSLLFVDQESGTLLHEAIVFKPE